MLLFPKYHSSLLVSAVRRTLQYSAAEVLRVAASAESSADQLVRCYLVNRKV